VYLLPEIRPYGGSRPTSAETAEDTKLAPKLPGVDRHEPSNVTYLFAKVRRLRFALQAHRTSRGESI
jgi:hypothetical protein